MLTDETFLEGLQHLTNGRVEQAKEQFQTLVEREAPNTPDALYLLGVCAYLGEDEKSALELLDWSKTAGAVSASFFSHFGKIIDALGDPRGDDLHRFLQRHRHIPWQHVGKLGGEILHSNLEPWYFSPQIVNIFPPKQTAFNDPQQIIEKYIIPGFVPVSPLFNKDTVLLTMGSCFAQELRNYLEEKGRRSDWLFVPPGLNNTFAVRNFVEWCLTGDQSSDAYWYDESSDGKARKWVPEAEQQRYQSVFETIDGIVLTVGLAEVWYSTETGGVFWRGVPKSIYNPDIHKCRISSVEENASNLLRMIDIIHTKRPGLPIILTLSPIPLKATFEPVSCFAADCLSKSTLRVAIERVLQAKRANVSYWPSFEIVRWLGGHLNTSMFGEDGNTRHVNRGTVKLVLDSFIKSYFGAA